MPLVDYASDSDSSAPVSDPPDTPARKKPRTASPPRNAGPGPGAGPGSTSALPPLPASFHDLYASTVRTTTRDDPTLHQGRTRQNPHVRGNWPSHIYIEWHPTAAVHALLAGLISTLQESAKAALGGAEVTSFLQSDLAAPQPLHISLSRPIVLASEEKDLFLGDVERAIEGSAIAAFTLRCSKAEWHRTAESGRSFLVLRVHGNQAAPGDDADPPGNDNNRNPQLTELLRRCNLVVANYQQPELYQWAEDAGERRIGDAFHVSVAWSFAEPTEDLVKATEKVFDGREVKKRIQEVQVPVHGVKVKIGNVVTHAALRQPRTRTGGKARNVLGL